jgi:translation elongation factor EF-G
MQALIERIRPVMTVNKLDRCFLELMLDGEEAYSGFRRTIESANVIMATYADELLGDTQVETCPLCIHEYPVHMHHGKLSLLTVRFDVLHQIFQSNMAPFFPLCEPLRQAFL